jgi:hypothetical protein
VTKLYWRVKRGGKWTWVAAQDVQVEQVRGVLRYSTPLPLPSVYKSQEEEE